MLFGSLFSVRAQEPPTAPAPASSSASAKTREPSSLNDGGTYTSLDGRFSVSLPQRNDGYSSLVIKTPVGLARGDAYTWRMKEAAFVIGYAQIPTSVDSPEIAKQIFESLREQLKKLAKDNNGTVGEDKPITLDKHPGVEQRVDLFSGFMVQRTYLVSSRLYQTLMIVKTTQRDYEALAFKALDIFKILSEAEVATKLAELVKKAEPDPLPQTPVAQRAGSDARDFGFHGRIKTVLEESQDLSGTWSVQTRKRDSLENYNEQGNLVRRESYDYKGNLSEIWVYGYIDGSRVSNFNSIRREYNPPPASVSAAPGTEVKKSDSRYLTRFEFKYDEQKRLIEKSWFHNNGSLSIRYVFNYNGNQREELVYSSDGLLNQRYVSIVDAKGHEQERTSFDTRDNVSKAKYSYAYEFDAEGNWIKRTTSKAVTKDGRSQLEPQYVDFRTITYW